MQKSESNENDWAYFFQVSFVEWINALCALSRYSSSFFADRQSRVKLLILNELQIQIYVYVYSSRIIERTVNYQDKKPSKVPFFSYFYSKRTLLFRSSFWFICFKPFICLLFFFLHQKNKREFCSIYHAIFRSIFFYDGSSFYRSFNVNVQTNAETVL